jgi:serine/threonine protein kinase/Tol biopolymer transport system component
MQLAPHQFIDHYEIIALLGSGGMGEVYRARDSRLNRDVAIKVMPGVSTSDTQRLRRFELEARAAASLNHPNILAVYQMGVFQGAPYLVSELLEGETLRDAMKQGPLPVRKVIDYGSQIARGLAAAHEKGIVHRDLKPENLFATREGHVKILDFGLARLTQPRESEIPQSPQDAQTMAGILLGSVGYMAPEQVRGQVADHRSDIFTFSAVLYEMLTGKRAFQKPSSIDTMSSILNEDPVPLAQLAPGASPGLQRVIQRGLEKNPEQRFQSASDLGFALQALTQDVHSSTMTSSHVGRNYPAALRKRWIAIAGAVALAAVAICVYLWMRPLPQPTVANYVQLTHDGMQKTLIGTDGSRLFLSVVDSGVQDVAAIPISGGEQTRIPMPKAGMFPVDLSPDGSAFLVVEGSGYPAVGPLWSLPILGDSPRRLGDVTGQIGAWSGDGKRLAYAKNSDVFAARADGSDPHKLASMKNIVSGLAWSPDGTQLRVETEEISQSGTSVVVGERAIWDEPDDGSTPHPVTDWANQKSECCGKWTADGKDFVFQSQGQIYALSNAGHFLQPKPKPIQLTSSPMQLQSPLPSRDGKKLFVVGMTFRGELTQFDLKTGVASLYLGGISADWIDSTRDGKQLTYVSYPQGDLWKCNADGTGRVQLTFGSSKPVLPRWSPDEQSIVFFEFPGGAGHPGKMFQVSASGGTPHELIPSDKQNEQDPTWSPDGKRIAFAGDANDASVQSLGPAIRILDLQSEKVSPLPGSQGMFSPRWSPDGRYIAAMTSDSSKLMLFDLQSNAWKSIGTGTLSWLNWSRDGQYVYLKDLSGKGSVVRIRAADGKREQLVDLKDFVLTGLGGGSVSVAPDGSPLLLRDRGTQDVYSLDWIQP